MWPPGVIHIQEFSKVLYKLAEMVIKTPLPMVVKTDGTKELTKESMNGLIKIVVPLVLTDLFDLLQKCVDIDLKAERLPHWVLPQIASVWIEESFFKEEAIRPWVQVIENTLEKVTKEKVNLSDIWSRFSSPAASAIRTSSVTDNTVPPTADGASDSSTTTTEEQ